MPLDLKKDSASFSFSYSFKINFNVLKIYFKHLFSVLGSQKCSPLSTLVCLPCASVAYYRAQGSGKTTPEHTWQGGRWSRVTRLDGKRIVFGLEADHVFLAGFDFEVKEAVRAFDLDVRLPASGEDHLGRTAFLPFKVYDMASSGLESL